MNENNQPYNITTNSQSLQQTPVEIQVNPTVEMVNSQGQSAKKPIKASVMSYFVRYYLTIIAACVLLSAGVSSVNTSGFMGGFAAVGYFFVAAPIAALIVLAINLIFTFNFINKNIDKNDKQVNKKFVAKYCLTAVLFVALVLAVQMFISFTSETISLSLMSFFLLPLFIPFSLFLLKKDIVDRKTIHASIVTLLILATIVPLSIGLWSVIGSLELYMALGLTSLLFALASSLSLGAFFILAFLPFLTISLIMLNRNNLTSSV